MDSYRHLTFQIIVLKMQVRGKLIFLRIYLSTLLEAEI